MSIFIYSSCVRVLPYFDIRSCFTIITHTYIKLKCPSLWPYIGYVSSKRHDSWCRILVYIFYLLFPLWGFKIHLYFVIQYSNKEFRTQFLEPLIYCSHFWLRLSSAGVRLHLKCDGTHAETRFRLSVKRTSPFKSTTGSRGVRISGSNAGYTMFRSSVKSTGYPLHSPVSPSLPLPCVTVFHHISTGLYYGQCYFF